jgi:polygalacturonase
MRCKKNAGSVLAACVYVLAGFTIQKTAALPDHKIPVKTETATQKIFDVRQFGAKGDGVTLDTQAIQKAIDECNKAGGGIVQLTAGTYLSKPIFLRSDITLQLNEGAVLKATDEPTDFADPEGSRRVIAFINGRNLTNVAITGKGTIDGSGRRWWGPAREAKLAKRPETQRRPRLVVLSECVNLRVQGVTLTNSPSFHLVPQNCENVDIDGASFIAPDESPNTDAIDPSTSRHVRIINCHIDVGDDNVAIKSGRRNPAHPDAACEDITVADCKFFHGHGMSIGSETTGGVKNLNVERVTFDNTESGVRIKSNQGRGGLVENISYSDLTMNNVNAPINITAYYPKIPREDTNEPVTSTTPVYRNIRITNLTATSSKNAGYIVGRPGAPVTGVTLENVHITAPKGLTIRNAKVTLKNVRIDVQKGPPFILENNAEVIGLK